MHRGVRIDGDVVRHLRRCKGLSQLQLAQSAGIAERTVRNAEKSLVLETHIANFLATALDVALNEIVVERALLSRTRRLRTLTRQVTTRFLQAVIEGESLGLLELSHPNIQWNCLANPDQSVIGICSGHDELRAHLACLMRWWEQYSVQPTDFSLLRADAEGDMVYFLLTAVIELPDSSKLEIWQTFICRFDDDLLISVDHCTGSQLVSKHRTMAT